MVNLISFPRAGCHWLMRVIELCTDRPRMSRHGYALPWYDSKRDPWGVHHHDYEFVTDSGRIKLLKDELTPEKFSHVIYLHRNQLILCIHCSNSLTVQKQQKTSRWQAAPTTCTKKNG